jgi:hypothetical protein
MNTWLKVLTRVGPMILGGFQATAPFAPILIDAVAKAEQGHDTTGPQKKQQALAAVDRYVAAYNATTTGPKLDPVVVRTIAAMAIDPLIATVNTWARSPIDHQADASTQ